MLHRKFVVQACLGINSKLLSENFLKLKGLEIACLANTKP
jgi:hypothetical protein